MKLQLRHFLLICLLLGGVAIPFGWRSYQTWKSGKIDRLEKELTELWANEPDNFVWNDTPDLTTGLSVELGVETDYLMGSMRLEANPLHATWKSAVKKIQDRLEKLTGVRPGNGPVPPVMMKGITDGRGDVEIRIGRGTAKQIAAYEEALQEQRK